MTWQYNVARNRILNLIDEVPSIDVQQFHTDYLPSYNQRKMLNEKEGSKTTPPLFGLPKGKAIVVDTVQIYVNIVNYNEYKINNGEETEESHERALRFLHFHYTACDRVMQNSSVQRVDFHDGRMHAVILAPTDEGVSLDTISDAF